MASTTVKQFKRTGLRETEAMFKSRPSRSLFTPCFFSSRLPASEPAFWRKVTSTTMGCTSKCMKCNRAPRAARTHASTSTEAKGGVRQREEAWFLAHRAGLAFGKEDARPLAKVCRGATALRSLLTLGMSSMRSRGRSRRAR